MESVNQCQSANSNVSISILGLLIQSIVQAKWDVTVPSYWPSDYGMKYIENGRKNSNLL